MSFKDRVIFITGAGSGIGAVAARMFAEAGGTVIIADIDQDKGANVATQIGSKGGAATFLRTDITDPASVADSVKQAIGQYGTIDVLYNNAGGTRPGDGKLTDSLDDAFWNAIRVDLFGAWQCSKHVLPHMVRNRRGVVINMTSISAIIGHRNIDAYTTAKGGIAALTRSLAVQFAPQGIRVNAIAPGATKTERIRAMMAQGRVSGDLVNRHLLGLMEPEQIANVALFLASDASSGITGQIIVVDGGATITAVNREEA